MSLKVSFYKETQFKDTLLGRIPKEWEVKRLGNFLTDFIRGVSYKQYQVSLEAKDRYIPLLRATNLLSNKISFEEVIYIPKTLINKNQLLRKGDIVITTSSGSINLVGRAVYVKEEITKPITIGAFLAILRFKNIFIDYLSYLFKSGFYRKHLNKLIIGTNINNLRKQHILSFKIPLPPLEEQKAIAKVLKDFDDLIEVIEEKIKTYERIKKALMKHYFSKGVFEHRKFKDTPIGRIPKEWKVITLGNPPYFKIIMGQSPPSKTYNTTGLGEPFLQGSGEFGYLYPKSEKFTSKPLKVVPKNSVLISVRAPVGDVNIADREYCIGGGLASVVPKNVDLLYLFYILSYSKPKLEQLGGGSTFKAISKQQLENFPIPLPSLEEQKEIAKRLKAIDDQIENLKEQKERLKRIQKHFMELLLTGKVRVKSHEE